MYYALRELIHDFHHHRFVQASVAVVDYLNKVLIYDESFMIYNTYEVPRYSYIFGYDPANFFFTAFIISSRCLFANSTNNL